MNACDGYFPVRLLDVDQTAVRLLYSGSVLFPHTPEPRFSNGSLLPESKYPYTARKYSACLAHLAGCIPLWISTSACPLILLLCTLQLKTLGQRTTTFDFLERFILNLIPYWKSDGMPELARLFPYLLEEGQKFTWETFSVHRSACRITFARA